MKDKREIRVINKGVAENGTHMVICIDIGTRIKDRNKLIELFINNPHEKRLKLIISNLLKFDNKISPEMYHATDADMRITCMVLSKGKDNLRIYCKEYKLNNQKLIVLCEANNKPGQNPNDVPKIKSCIERLKNQEHNLENPKWFF